MATRQENLGAEAMKLTDPECARLVEYRIAGPNEDAEIEDAWAVEVERRISEIEAGQVQMLPAAEAIAQARAALK